MLTQQEVIAAVKSKSFRFNAIDGRDASRLIEFFPKSEWPTFGMKPTNDDPFEPKPWTREAVVEQMRDDVAFGFEKALDKRGISASLMHGVVMMWLFVLNDDLKTHDEYAQYGLPLLKAVAVKFGFPNPIGGDRGDEDQYASY